MAVEIGIGNASPSKIITVRRQMRTRRERTSGAWMRGCELNPGGEDENTRTAGDKYSYPKQYSGSMERTVFLQDPWRTCSMPDPTSLESIKGVLVKVK